MNLISLDLDNLIPISFSGKKLSKELILEQFELNLKKLVEIEKHECINNNIRIFIIGKWSKFFTIKNDKIKRSYEKYTEYERVIVEKCIDILYIYLTGVQRHEDDIVFFQNFKVINNLIITDSQEFEKCLDVNGVITISDMNYIVNFFKE